MEGILVGRGRVHGAVRLILPFGMNHLNDENRVIYDAVQYVERRPSHRQAPNIPLDNRTRIRKFGQNV